jgi:hypothetical protein
MSDPRQSPLEKFIEKIKTSRDFTISLLIHIIFVAIFGTTVLFKATQEPPDFEGGEGGFVGAPEASNLPPPPPAEQLPQTPDITVTATPTNTANVQAITTTATTPAAFTMTQMVMAPPVPVAPTATQMSTPKPTVNASVGTSMSKETAAAIKAFSGGWGKGQGSGTGTRAREFEFIAYIGQYSGGNWKSTVELKKGDNGKEVIWKGSLPNLLHYMSLHSGSKIKTNYKNVEAIKLDTDEIFQKKPPFILLTGTRDFRLSDTEVENLRKYVRVGGAIWGDSSVPGRNSRFDIAFRREMKRIIPDKDKDWEELPAKHPIFDPGQAYFNDVKTVPPGINYYKEPIYALKIYGEVAIIYTANDYGDMWQVGLTDDSKQIDLSKTGNDLIAVNPAIWNPYDSELKNNSYIRNIEPAALDLTYKFGTNIIIHLLTRWESKTKSAQSL